MLLWSLEELEPLNRSHRDEGFAPGLLIFGSTGGGEAYGFDTRLEPWMIVSIPFIPMDWEDAIPISDSFTGFLLAMQNNWNLGEALKRT